MASKRSLVDLRCTSLDATRALKAANLLEAAVPRSGPEAGPCARSWALPEARGIRSGGPSPPVISRHEVPASRARTRARRAAMRAAAGVMSSTGAPSAVCICVTTCSGASRGRPVTGWMPERSANKRRAAPSTARLQRALEAHPSTLEARVREARSGRARVPTALCRVTVHRPVATVEGTPRLGFAMLRPLMEA